MNEHRAVDAATSRYALQIHGEQAEYGLTENVFRFEACLSSLTDRSDLSMMHGLLVEHDGGGDLCIEVLRSAKAGSRCEPVKLSFGSEASKALTGAVDVRMRTHRSSILFMYHPTVLDEGSRRQPGTRLLSSLQRHFAGRSLDVLVDLGTSEGDVAFNDYFFPDLDLIGLRASGARLARGHWGTNEGQEVAPYDFGVVYGAT